MKDLGFITQFVYENFELVTISNEGTHFHARCPICGDSKKSLSKKRFHLDWSPARCVWQCWNCGRSGNFVQLYAKIKGLTNSEAFKILHKFDYEGLKESLRKQNGRAQHKKFKRPDQYYNYILDDCVSKDLKVESVLYNSWIKVLDDFVQDRHIPQNYNIYFAYKGKYRNRIIIPIFDENNNIIYFQARRLPGSKAPNKYKNPPTEKSLIILNEDKFDKSKYIVITEGLLDAFPIDNQGTACLGKEINEDFLKILFDKTEVGIIIAFDNDPDGRKALTEFLFGKDKRKPNKYNKKVKYFLMPKNFSMYKDINKISNKVKNVYNFIIENSYNYIETIMKLRLED